MTPTRVATGIDGLDRMLAGGFLPGATVLVRGAPGTGKTSLAFQFLLEGTRKGERGLFITFEEFPRDLYRDARSLGFDLRALEEAGMLHTIFTSPEVVLDGLQNPDSPIFQIIAGEDIRRAAVDSITHFTRLTDDPDALRTVYSTIINALHRDQITTLLLSEENRANDRAESGGLDYLCDGIILMRYVEVESTIKRAIVVLKLRGSDHAREIRHYRFEDHGIVVGQVFRRREAILTGISRRT